jgi:hypothetical protein
VPVPVAQLFLAGATAAITYLFQELSKQNEAARQTGLAKIDRAKAELARAEKIHADVSTSLSALHFWLYDEATYIAARRYDEKPDEPMDSENWKTFEALFSSYKQNRVFNSANIELYFGAENKKRFDNISRNHIDKALSDIERAYYKRKTAVLIKGEDGSYFPAAHYKNRDAVEQEIMALSQHMMKDIQSQNVGFMRHPEAVLELSKLP